MPDQAVNTPSPTAPAAAAPATPAAPTPSPEQQSLAAPPPSTDWRQGIPPEFRENPAIKPFTDLGGLAKSYIEAQSRLGTSVRIPSREAGPEDRAAFRKRMLEVGTDHGLTVVPEEGEDTAAFYRALGAPAKPEEYELPEFKDPEFGEVDFSEADALRPVAHQLGISKRQFKGLVEAATKANLAEQGAVLRRQQADRAALEKEWGAAHPIRMTALAKFLEINQAPQPLRAAVEDGIIDSGSAKWLYAMMETLGGEAAEIAAQGKGAGRNILTPTEAIERVAEIEKKMMTMPQGSDEYNTLMRRRIELIQLAG